MALEETRRGEGVVGEEQCDETLFREREGGGNVLFISHMIAGLEWKVKARKSGK